MKLLPALIVALSMVVACGGSQKKADPKPTDPAPRVEQTRPAPPDPVEEPSANAGFTGDPYRLLEEPEKRGPRDLVLVAVGDVSQPTTQWVEDTTRLEEKVFDPTRHLTSSGDLNFMNLENPVTHLQPNARKTYAFTSDPRRLDWYFGAGFNMYSLANNHIADAGQPGIDESIENLKKYAEKNGMPVYFAGAGSTPEEGLAPLIFTPEGKNLKIAFFSLGFSKSENVGKFWDENLEAEIKKAREIADIVIVSSHAGKEYIHIPEDDLKERYRNWVDWGVDLVIAHHTHCIRPIEAYKGALIFHGLGNFVFMSRTVRHRKMGAKLYGMLTRIVIRDGKVHGAEIVPTWVNNSDDWKLGDEVMPNANFVPQVLKGPFAAAYFEDLNGWAEKSGLTQVEVRDGVGYVTVTAPE